MDMHLAMDGPPRQRETQLAIDGALAVYEVSDLEVLTGTLLGALIIEARNRGVINLDLLLPTERISDRELLTNFGFDWAGTTQVNRDRRAVTFIHFRRCVRVSDGVETYGNTTLAPSKEEEAAVEHVKQKFAAPLTEQRLAELVAMGKNEAKDESQPDLVIENMRAEIAQMEAALKSEQEAKSKKQEEVEVPQPPKPEVDHSENRRACVQWTPL